MSTMSVSGATAVIIATGTSNPRSRIASSTSSPDSVGIRRSNSTASTSAVIASRAASPLFATIGTYCPASSQYSQVSARSSSSSTTSTTGASSRDGASSVESILIASVFSQPS